MMEVCIRLYTVIFFLCAVCVEKYGIFGRLVPAKVQILSQNSLENPGRGTNIKVDSGRRAVRFGGTLSMTKLENSHLMGNMTIGCRRRRMRKFIGNRERNCTSLKPLKFLVCIGLCIPKERVNRYFVSFQRLKLKTEFKYRCSPHTFKYKKIRVYCGDDGSVTRFRVKVVESCKCKEFKDQQNELQTPAEKIEERLRILSPKEAAMSPNRRP